ncbi:bifunctional (p)ppGpp synthetase/guanosine-3',5'-bis(diphosphate) 3'-pyrophosphohydrolase [Parabacteroides sp. AGMB00274]|uniref:Bifunctional (P)ppGpp synthetase/guanosine-3',5'-bis(Diphosphate) 3'-pyrophosphohydrolase n=1 Tax=Parabacteroides faecalis TaxID=2924040 RepID=A0ABT0C0I4_9BACT|nr:bifunctional (p)ppGpp synthetase/guanosine-3',5'-bis(diphosphate) 3'-pyrophosphohydrolase [Parabacteroides faecalis]MBS7343651.1 bifunctional (p)ppGpp synthetase/guanosine-3',5'-bis(diphosphate) 3'-pyrophosphohydrolase [Parabacteroides sp.]MCI7357599.1 bifunctional (p)ppGpp synthetase/guanosine-3',5'-bis(diphosphate) 3'-pyrophosphohydrolase [Parabacteroides sp.]MCJ2380534.1 bifunctional (p)ppGpp synthetase/guanosine-3',5'-bis(diphosphate) 3'-pyrophosphohydrolase [Parabacteroides faecalis]
MKDMLNTNKPNAGTTEASKLSPDEQMIQDGFNDLLQDYLNSNHRRKVERITKAFNFAKQAHDGVKRRSGEPYIMHPIAVAKIVCSEMGLGSTSICAALLHDVVEDTEYTVEDIRNMFGDKIAQIVDGLTKISGGIFGEQASAQAENFRKLLLTMSDDIRVILIKIADRLHNMRTLGSMLPAKQFKIAGETLYLYAPLAHRLGLFSIKTELEDLSFKYEHPQEYEAIRRKLEATASARELLFKHFAEPVDAKLKAMGLNYEMKARVKSIYSIWNKMQAKKVAFEDIYDIYAVRIIFDPLPGVDEKNQCWDIYSAITDIYRIRPDRIRDWVSRPKANGYQALHLTVMGPDGQWVEIQIRSRRMDDIAEKGFAAHWKYKENHVEEDTELDKWLQTITEILESPDPNALDFLDTIKLNLFSSEIFVFTPKGELKTLPQGATALDFAYALHSDVGNKCIGAKVNHKLVPLSHKLSSGDQVEVLTSRSQTPQAEWLNFVTTARARTKITAVVRRIRKETIKGGEAKVLAACQKSGVEPSAQNLDKLAMYYGFSKRDDLYYSVEKGDVVLPENVRKLFREKDENGLFKYVKQALRRATKYSKSTPEEAVNETQTKEKPVYDKKKPYILKEEAFERNYVIAECCKPIPGDESLGFINDDGNVVVHKRSCPIAMRLKSSFGERILNTVWSSHQLSSFEATLEVKGIDSLGVLNEITKIISEEFNVYIIRLLIEAKDGVFEGRIKLKVHDVEDIQKLCVRLSKIENIKSVSRIAD